MQNLLNPPLVFFTEAAPEFLSDFRPISTNFPCGVQLVNLRPLRVGEILLQLHRTDFDPKFGMTGLEKFCSDSTKFVEKIWNFLENFKGNRTSVEIFRTDLAGIRSFEMIRSPKEILNLLNLMKIESFLIKFR